MAVYELVLVDITPQQSAVPTRTELGPLPAPSIRYSDVLNGDGRLQCSVLPGSLTDTVKTALRALVDQDSDPDPLEVAVYRAGSKVWEGPLVGGNLQAGTVTLDARSVSFYLRWMFVTSDLTYTNVDQYTIAAGLVDHWQGLDYGDVGIDTSAVGTSGTTRDRTYLAAEQHNIHRQLTQLADVDGGFDWWVDTSRVLQLAASRGSDVSSSVVLDSRNVADAGISFSAGPYDVASEAFGLATSADAAPLTSTQSNVARRQTFGRRGTTGRFDGVSVQATLDSHTLQLLNDRDRTLFVPAPALVPISGVDVGDIGPGDTVQWAFDAGLGIQTFNRRLGQVAVSVDRDGAEEMAVEFT